MKRIAIAFVVGLILCGLSSCTPEETISVIKIESDISNLEVKESSSSSVESEPPQSSEVSEQMNTSSEDYKLDKTITIDGTTYTLKYKSTSKRSGGQWNDRHEYLTSDGAWFNFDVKTGRLISFFLNTSSESNVSISEQQAIKHAEDFVKTQVDLNLYQRKSVKEKEDCFYIQYVRLHLGYSSEHIKIKVSKQGKITSFIACYDSDNIVLSVKELDLQKVRETLSELTGESNFEIYINSWIINEKNKPALYLFYKSLNTGKYNNLAVEIESDGSYNAYEVETPTAT